MSCESISFWRRILNWLFRKNNSTTVNVCRKSSITCCSNMERSTSTTDLSIEDNSENLEVSSTKHQKRSKSLDSPKSNLKRQGAIKRRSQPTTVATVLEIRSTIPRPLPPPRVNLEDGWSVYFGDQVGIPTSNYTHLHIRNTLDGSDGISMNADMISCLIKGLLALQRK